jgi:hypothetical protein
MDGGGRATPGAVAGTAVEERFTHSQWGRAITQRMQHTMTERIPAVAFRWSLMRSNGAGAIRLLSCYVRPVLAAARKTF